MLPSTLLTIALPFFGLIGCGYLAGLARWMVERDVAALNRFVVLFALPAFVFSRVAGADAALAAFDARFAAAYGGATVLLFGVGLAASRVLFRSALPEAALQGLAGAFSNTGYLGLPLAVATYGDAAALPAIIIFTFDNTLLLLLTLALVERGTASSAASRLGLRGWLDRLLLRNPLFAAIALGALAQAVRVPVPEVLLAFARLLGGAAAPGGLFALGASLALRSTAAGTGPMLLTTGLKLVGHPLVMLGAMLLAAPDPLWARVAVLSAGLPIGATVYVLAAQYRVATSLASTAVLVTTVLAAASVPLLITALGGSR